LVLGISPQDAGSHRAFARKFSLNFPLLVDGELAVAASYGAVRPIAGVSPEQGMAEVPLKVKRSTFVVDVDGRIAEALYDVRAKGHVDQLRSHLLRESPTGSV
jgi:peroxiredoxin Q/BCP